MNLRNKMAVLTSLHIGPLPKAMIALTVLGLKPAVELDLFLYNTAHEECKLALESIGLKVFPVALSEEKRNPKQTAKFCISSDEGTARMLAVLACDREHLYKKGWPAPYFHKMYGVLMGYPLSAVQAFISNQVLSEDDNVYPSSMRGNLLAVFKFSKDHWAEESEVVYEWEANLELHAPKILKELQSCYAS